MELDPVELLDQYKSLTPDGSAEGREPPIRSDLEAELAHMPEEEPASEADTNLTMGEIQGQQMDETKDDQVAKEVAKTDEKAVTEEKKLKVKIDGKVEEVSESEIPEEERNLDAKQMIIAANRKMQDVAERERVATEKEMKILETTTQLNDFMERAKQDVFAALEHVGYSREDLERSAARILKERIDRDALPPEEKVKIEADKRVAQEAERANRAEAQLREAENARYAQTLESLTNSAFASHNLEDKVVTRNIVSRFLIDEYKANYAHPTNARDKQFEADMPQLMDKACKFVIFEVPSLVKATPKAAPAEEDKSSNVSSAPQKAKGKRARTVSEAMETGNFSGLEDKIFEIMKR